LDLREKTKTARTIDKLLRKEYGVPSSRTATDPLDVLIQTVLSQNTTDLNSDRAFNRLRARFGNWNAVRRASPGEIEEAIRVGGLAETKAPRIRDILVHIHNRCGSTSLQSLCTMEPDQAAIFLSGFVGVGPKTVNCVLLFGCGMDAFPVDTHILRISKRLGLVPENTGLARAHRLWAEFLPRGSAHCLHINLIEHGRRICRARNPQCDRCCLRRFCNYPTADRHLSDSQDECALL
jgi:endonuclease-3